MARLASGFLIEVRGRQAYTSQGEFPVKSGVARHPAPTRLIKSIGVYGAVVVV